LRIAGLLASDGNIGGTRILPAGWAQEMARPSRVNAGTAMQLRRAVIDNAAILSATDGNGSEFWVAPDLGLVIVNIAGIGGGSAPDLPELLLRAFSAA
jgi:CubicO group peptidase (beta-lactamase class C family)